MEVSFHIYNELMDLERRLIPSLYNNKFFEEAMSGESPMIMYYNEYKLLTLRRL